MTDKSPESHVKRIEREISDLGEIFRKNWKVGLFVVFVGLIFFSIENGLVSSSFSLLSNDKPDLPTSSEQAATVDSSAARRSSSSSSPSGALVIQNGELLVIKSSAGMAVLEMSFKDSCEASYRWRFKPVNGGSELSGSANLFEQYGVAQDSSHVTDLASELVVAAGPLKTLWSCNSSNSGWIYPSSGLEVYAIKNMSFEKFRL